MELSSQKPDRYRNSRPEVFCEKGVLRNSQNSQENTCARVSFLIKLQAAPDITSGFLVRVIIFAKEVGFLF